MDETTAACRSRVRKEVSVRRAEVRRMHAEEVKAITGDWKEGFARLKGENDERQKRNATFLKEQMTEIEDWLGDALVGCQK